MGHKIGKKKVIAVVEHKSAVQPIKFSLHNLPLIQSQIFQLLYTHFT